MSGPYRWLRNPMYLAVTAVIIGQAFLFRSWSLVAYAAVAVACVVTFVHWWE